MASIVIFKVLPVLELINGRSVCCFVLKAYDNDGWGP